MAHQKHSTGNTISAQGILHVRLYRSRSQEREDASAEGEYKDYQVPFEDRMTVMRLLDIVHRDIDRSLAYYKSCRTGLCVGCLVDVDGTNALACSTLAKEGMRIGPAKGYKVIRDLLVEFPQ